MGLNRFRACAWCGALTSAIDADGDPACADGVGCAAPKRAKAPPISRHTIVRVAGRTRTLGEWAQHLDVTVKSILQRARLRDRSLHDELELRVFERRQRVFNVTQLARRFGITPDAFRKRVQRVGFDRAVEMGPKLSWRGGIRPNRGESLDTIAARFGVTRQALHKAARLAGRTLDEEIARRLESQNLWRAA